jgi:hypothetical protein
MSEYGNNITKSGLIKAKKQLNDDLKRLIRKEQEAWDEHLKNIHNPTELKGFWKMIFNKYSV